MRIKNDSTDDGVVDPTCGRCGGDTVPIVYGYPGGDLFEAADRGEVALGGCVVFDGRPTRRCKNCNATFGSAGT